MQIALNTYADFLTAVRTIGGLEVVFYYDDSPSSFKVQAIFGGRTIINTFSTPLTSKPGTFDADFPDAVELPGNFGIGT